MLLLVFVVIEIYLIVDFVGVVHHYGDIPLPEMLSKSELLLKFILIIIVSIGPFGFSFHFFRKLVEKEYLSREFVVEEHLKKFFHHRFNLLKENNGIKRKEKVDGLAEKLSRQTLMFLENILSEYIGKHHYELSLFSDDDHPEIVCYFDSNNHEVPRSAKDRQEDPDYYKKKNYAVVDLLLSPVTKPIVHSITKARGVNYSFVDQHQKRFIKSTILYCFDVETPKVLVVTCDKDDAFNQEDGRILALITACALAIRGEYELGNLINSCLPVK